MTKMNVLLGVLALMVGVSNAEAADVDTSQTDSDGFVSVFDGQSLENWTGDPQYWSVKEGAITGVADGSLKMNHFLTLAALYLRQRSPLSASG